MFAGLNCSGASASTIGGKYSFDAIRDADDNADADDNDQKKTSTYSISGTVKSSGGVVMGNVGVYLYDQASSAAISAVTTDAAGAYAFTSLAAGTYKLGVEGGTFYIYGTTGVATPSIFSVDPIASNIAVAGAVVKDLTLPAFVTLSGKTTDNNGVAVPGVTLSVSTAHWTRDGINYSCSNDDDTITSDASGNYSMALLPYAGYAVTLTPSAANKTVSPTVINPLNASVTATKNLKMAPASSISGTVKSSGGAVMKNVRVYLYGQASSSSSTYVTTDAAGAYAFTSLAAGTYKLSVEGGIYGTTGVATPCMFSVNPVASNISASGAVIKDLTLPAFVTLGGKITDNNGVAVPGVALSVSPAYWTRDGINYSCSNNGTSADAIKSDASGNYSMTLLPYDSYALTVTPPASSKFLAATLSPYPVTSSTLNNISLNKSTKEYKLSTKISGTNGGITSSPAGINCKSGTCSWLFDTGAKITLTSNSTGFSGWSGACSGKSAACSLTMVADQTAVANYIDTTDPVLALSTLADKAITNNATLNISGTATDDAAVATITINGKPVAFNATDGSFSHAFTLLPGDNKITTIVSDAAGNTASDSRTVTLDQAAPLLAVAAPADNIKTAASSITVSGTVDKTSTVQVTDNGSTQLSAAMTGNTFTVSVNLVPGINTIGITATDLAGNSSTAKRTVVCDNLNPTLAVTDPGQDSSTVQAAMIIKGTVSDTITNATVLITVDGSHYTPVVTNGAFSQQISFAAEKTYQVIVTATDEVGNASTVRRNIIYSSQSFGDVNGDGVVDAKDALRALQIVLGEVAPSTAELMRGDVAPLINGKPVPDGIIDIGDAVLIIERVVGLKTW
ncbi:MAG TPA: carboxypeptidase regulatory-like domain-containing protein [Dongiaceae bacterium]|nr:carboxypeptidase regulatory-like domain-containing protein [Dongiaceae bacterium]